MSCEDVTNAFVTTLSSASVFGSGNVATNFKVLESSSACACVVGVIGLESEQDTFGMGGESQWNTAWTFSTRLFLKDTGSYTTLMNAIPRAIDKLVIAMRDDPDLQGTVEEILEIRALRDPDLAFTAGGHTWISVNAEVTVREWI